MEWIRREMIGERVREREREREIELMTLSVEHVDHCQAQMDGRQGGGAKGF